MIVEPHHDLQRSDKKTNEEWGEHGKRTSTHFIEDLAIPSICKVLYHLVSRFHGRV
jgi:hypothetical protein